MRKLCRNRQGLSPIISTLLLIMIVMVGMTVVFSAVVFYSNAYQAGAGSSILESLTIEDVWILNSNYVNITVYNSGTAANLGANSGVDITISGIYASGLELAPSDGGNFNQFVIPAGAHVTIPCEWPPSTGMSFQPGYTYDFKIVTMRGSNFETQVQYANS